MNLVEDFPRLKFVVVVYVRRSTGGGSDLPRGGN